VQQLSELIPEDVRRWEPRMQKHLLERVRDGARTRRQVWYCTRGRACPGTPHDGAPYGHARPLQRPPAGKWLTWLNTSGRGAGKTRSGAEFTRHSTRFAGRIALVGPTGPDARDVMVEGDSGLIAVCERAGEPVEWEPSKKKLTFANGAVGHVFSAEEPDRLRGPQHAFAWCDEPAHWDLARECWDNLTLGLRLGRSPRIVATTTPLPTTWLRWLAEQPSTVVTSESTYANLANLAEPFAEEVLKRFEHTRAGRQELYGEILPDVEGALWTPEMVHHVEHSQVPHMDDVVVGVDPAGTNRRRSDETGIVVVGRSGDVLYVLADHSGQYSPGEWSARAAADYETYSARAIVAEQNYGGDMVRDTLHNANHFMPVIEVNSRRGKDSRAEPVVALYEQRRVLHVVAAGPLVDQMLSWVPGKGTSPDRVDALVHAVHALVKVAPPSQIARPTGTIARRRAASPKVPRSLRIIGGLS
jgi:phage terminase large subunit-like protein